MSDQTLHDVVIDEHSAGVTVKVRYEGRWFRLGPAGVTAILELRRELVAWRAGRKATPGASVRE